MTEWKRTWMDPKSGCRIDMTSQAIFVIGHDRVASFAEELFKFMIRVEAHQAYVAKRGVCIEVTLFRNL